jgi:GMP synthase (glutamine-hydrolysing)
MRVLSIQPDSDTPLGLIEPRLVAAGIELETWQPRFEPPPAGPFDGLVVLGSVTDPDEDRFEPWIGAVRGEISLGLELRLPMLGICFGAQLITQELGGSVERMPAAEIGWFELTPTPEGASDQLLRAMPRDGVSLLQWHQFRMLPPSSVVRLVNPTSCEQAYRAEQRNVWAIQFHFEADDRIAEDWVGSDGDALAARGIDVAAIRAGTSAHAEVARQVAEEIADGFASVVKQHALG